MDQRNDHGGTDNMTLALEALLGDIFQTKPAKRKDTSAATRARCHRLAKKLGYHITIDRDPYSGNGYWIEGTDWPDEIFSTSWEEVEDKLLSEVNRRKIGVDTE
jgi:hypothetical protein